MARSSSSSSSIDFGELTGDPVDGVRVAFDARAAGTHLHPQHDQPLLDAIVQVVCETLAFAVARPDHPTGRLLQRLGLLTDDQQLRPQRPAHALERLAELTDLVLAVDLERARRADRQRWPAPSA